MSEEKKTERKRIVAIFFTDEVKLGVEYLSYINADSWVLDFDDKRLGPGWLTIRGKDIKSYIEVTIPTVHIKNVQWG